MGNGVKVLVVVAIVVAAIMWIYHGFHLPF